RSEKVILWLFKGLKKGTATAYITMNLVANMLGMGSAATPFGLKAMEELQKQNKDTDRASHEMCLFLIVNTASVQLLPLSIIAIRSAAGSADPTDIVIPAFLATLGTAILGIILAKICAKASRS
ncbi:MAG: nucleoside recognition protein, partial [Christensenellaceae bacterium]|nr:nucleoside recognition protein [Christensenellaceae bacterium]